MVTLGAIVKLTIVHDNVLDKSPLHRIPSLIMIERLKLDKRLEEMLLKSDEIRDGLIKGKSKVTKENTNGGTK